MKKILCPIDFTAASMSGLEYAFEVAKQFQSELFIFHSIQVSAQERGQNMLLPDDLRGLEEDAKYRLEKISLDMTSVIKQAGITHDYIVRFGSAEDEILKLVNELSIDMVIMGTGGAEGFAKLFGTLSANIIAKAPCPVLVIPPNTTFKKIDQIVYATDMQGNDESVIDYIISFAKAFNAHISFLNIRKQDDQNVDEIIPYRARIFTLTDYKKMSFQVIGNEQILDGVNSFAVGIKADLIVMATEKRNFMQTIFSKSKTKAVAYETKIPLLAMHKDELK